jgi:hypothetical protein
VFVFRIDFELIVTEAFQVFVDGNFYPCIQLFAKKSRYVAACYALERDIYFATQTMAGTTRRRTRVWKKKAKEERRNNKMWAEGAREDLMRPHVEAYADALQRGWRAERDYLQKVCNEFHGRISWRLQDHEEPDLPLPAYDPFAPPVAEELTDEEKNARHTRIQELNDVRDVTSCDISCLAHPLFLLNVANSAVAQVQGARAAVWIHNED